MALCWVLSRVPAQSSKTSSFGGTLAQPSGVALFFACTTRGHGLRGVTLATDQPYPDRIVAEHNARPATVPALRRADADEDRVNGSRVFCLAAQLRNCRSQRAERGRRISQAASTEDVCYTAPAQSSAVRPAGRQCAPASRGIALLPASGADAAPRRRIRCRRSSPQISDSGILTPVKARSCIAV